ncbi:FkbM family methyltransferase [Roseofilum sp. BLCC_M154]|uniref:FkbM family methyltransferase n=1 Tax=Roseofilum acuticapitatum BLCC-M154 TaxID=3022444 RepID=A0ABT7AP90_9CYAN|nr:FkbM family methyltransferase [Roseofilum acuticapitatum]MDJ1168126.1 FkbM family methyltransferase [Roseofilum acuticapitatum BLCC-M154]
MSFFELLDSCHRFIARSNPLFYLVIKVRNQCNLILRYHLSDGIDPVKNGESIVANIIAKNSSAFIDVGANIGNWSSAFLEGSSNDVRGLLFEPSNYAIEKLNSRFCENKNLNIVQACVADEPGSMKFYEEPEAGETSSLVKGASNSNAIEKTIEVTTIDIELERLNWEYVDFLKIDAEGYDLKVIRGAYKFLHAQKIGVVQFEYNLPWKHAESTLFSAISLLNSCGYQVFLLKGTGLYTMSYDIYGEYFSYSNFIAVAPQCMPMLNSLIQGVI